MEVGGVRAGWFLPRWGQQRAASDCLGGSSQRRVEIPGVCVPPTPTLGPWGSSYTGCRAHCRAEATAHIRSACRPLG